MHQHLELSDSKSTVVTSGCAGYGAVLARRTNATASVEKKGGGKGATKGGWYWEVGVLDTGVGGFSLGLCSAALPKPYKSLGNHPMAWVWHATGAILHNRTRVEPPTPETTVRVNM